LALSKTQVDKLGDRLRKAEVPTDDDLRLLSDFREDRRAAMDAVGAGLAEIVGLVPARRLKTINSIVDKLRRESARLSQIQDIAGLRIVRDMTRSEQDSLVERIVARFPDSKVFDRRAQPSHGYRAVHVIVAADRQLVEIQVRTALQHQWALLVERFASAWGQQIKYGEEPDHPSQVVGITESRASVIEMIRTLSRLVDQHERLALRAAVVDQRADTEFTADLTMAGEGLRRLIEAFTGGPL
jgi:putative GTP pyrophosphokinase